MKKLIAISVVFALVAGVAFAVDLGGTVTGSVNVLQGDTGKDAAGDAKPVTSSAEMKRMRLEGSGGDDVYGAWIRLGDSASPGFDGLAWWKPIDQLKLTVGGNPDGFFGKEGVTGWMFYQHAYDTNNVVAGNVWGWGHVLNDDWGNGGNYNVYGQHVKTRNAFYGGFGGQGAILEITPADIASINIVLPFFDGGETADVFKKTTAQVDLKLDFGNIALTYEGSLGVDDDKGNNESSSIFVYYGGSFGDLSIDFGLGYHTAIHDGNGDNFAQPIGVGLGVKYATDAFGVKFRTAANVAGDDKATALLVDVLPFFTLSESLRAYVSVGLGMTMPDGDDTITGWHFNPYLEVGSEWGPKFFAGIKVFSDGIDTGDGAVINWAVPISLMVSF